MAVRETPGPSLACPDLPAFTSRAFSACDPLQQFRRRLVVRILRHQLPAHGQIENEPAQARDRVGRIGDAVDNGRAGARRSSRQRLGQDRLQLVAQAPPSRPRRRQVGKQVLRVAVVVGDGVRVLDVEVVAARLHLVGGDLPGDLGSPRGPCASRRPTSRCTA